MRELTTREQVDKIIANLTYELTTCRDEEQCERLRESLMQYCDIQRTLELQDEIVQDLTAIQKDVAASQALIQEIEAML